MRKIIWGVGVKAANPLLKAANQTNIEDGQGVFSSTRAVAERGFAKMHQM